MRMSDLRNGRVVISDLAWEIAQSQADGNADQWVKRDDDADNDMRRTIAAAMNQHGWPLDGIPGVLPHILRMLDAGLITAHSTFNNMPPVAASEVEANPANWYLSSNDANFVVGSLVADAGLKRKYDGQAEDKMAAGRYTLSDAANTLERHTGERADGMLTKLRKSVSDSVLPVYEPGKQARYQPSTIREFYEEAHWDDLNKWLADNEPRIAWRFPAPAAQSEAMSPPASAAVNITTHRVNNRSNALAAVIASAVSTAVAPSDSQSVWAELVKLAELESKPAPLLGYSSDGIQYRGKKYEENGVPDVFTAKNLRDRMARAKAR